jgi:hypothetical protein
VAYKRREVVRAAVLAAVLAAAISCTTTKEQKDRARFDWCLGFCGEIELEHESKIEHESKVEGGKNE